MKAYYFYDWDCDTDEEYDLRGEEYRDLLSFCFSNSSAVSFSVSDPAIGEQECLKPYQIPRPKEIGDEIMKEIRYRPDIQVLFYRSCPEVCEWMKESAAGMFEWLNGRGFRNPDDPTFYRSDGSVLFRSVIHEGGLALFVRDTETPPDFVLKKPWTTKRRDYSAV